ncbi:MAG: SRPBCC family protein [Pseudonocardiaceae bacterium]
MRNHTVTHSTFTLERTYPASPVRAFRAWADPVTKARWFAGAGDVYELDFRVGGREVNQGSHEGGPTLTFESRYHDIVADERIVYSSTMTAAGHDTATVSLTTVEFVSEGEGTRLVLTEQGTFLDDLENPAWREQGTSDWLNALGLELGAEPPPRSSNA